jgi:uncharacterized protein YbaR (Trm112 family)
MAQCIICLKEHHAETVEHIVPRSLGNIHYILGKGKVCSNCNNRFARFEHDVVSSIPFMQRRLRLGIVEKIPADAKELPKGSIQLFLLKICYESVHKSRLKLLKTHHLDHLRQILLQAKLDKVYPIDQGYIPIKRLPQLLDHWRLRGAGIQLYLDEEHRNQLMFTFRYLDMRFTIGV